MNVVKDEKYNPKSKLQLVYIIIIAICIIAVTIAFIIHIMNTNKYILYSKKSKLPELTADKISKYKAEFNYIFKNKVNYLKNNAYEIEKNNKDQEIVYIGYQNHEKQINDFELDVNIPYINIKNKTVTEFNNQIKEIFEAKAKSVLETKNSNIIYTVNYSAYISNNILSVVVRSTLKEGMNPQRDIVQTYNYDLINQTKCNIDKLLELKGISKNNASKVIREEIKVVQKRVEELGKLGYPIYARDYTSDIYSVNNITEYFLGNDNALYIIYAYGNLNHTSEMDIIVM